jgi:site-specific DNA-methyltransferase (adenine-specific)
MEKLILGDCLEVMKTMESNSVSCIVTSPPYNKKGLIGKVKPGNQVWKKFNIDYDSYGDDLSEEDYHKWMVDILNEMKRIIKPDGSIFFNHKARRHKNKLHLPTDFISKSELDIYQLIIWNRLSSPNIRKDVLLPCTEHVYWLTKSKPKVFKENLSKEFQSEVWTINPDRNTKHPAPFPQKLVENCILLTTEDNDLVLDPFLGSGTSGIVSKKLNRTFIGIEIDEKYLNLSKNLLEVHTEK